MLLYDYSVFAATIFLILLWIYTSRENENVYLKQLLTKLFIYYDSLLFMIISKDGKGVGPKHNPDPDHISQEQCLKKKRIIFIRHGESDWNNVFNKGFNPSLLVRLAKAMVQESFLFLSPSLDSVFIDSPLNFEGIEQAMDLRKYLQNGIKTLGNTEVSTKSVLQILSGDDTSTSSVIVSSSLRRAIATTTLALWKRVTKTEEKIHILSSLQEISRNIDTYALSAANTCPDLPFSRIAPHCDGFAPSVFSCSDNFGNKSRSFYGIKRLKAFNDWAFNRTEDVIIVGGHSLWFKNYFQTYLPHKFDHDAKKKKIENSGVVAFDVYAAKDKDGSIRYKIDPKSLLTVYRGFTAK